MGTVYFKAPNEWTQAVFSGQNLATPKTVTTKNADGYFELDLSTLGLETYVNKFSIANKVGQGNIIVTDTVWQHQNPYDANALQNMATLTCPTTPTGMVYVAENPLKLNTTYIGSVPPNAKYFYVLLPEEKEWQSDDLMLRVTNAAGVSKDTAMIPASEYCGWFYMVFDEPPENIILFLKNTPDRQIGINGLWGESEVADPVNLKMLFDAFQVDKLFFIPDDNQWPDEGADQGWYIAYPEVEGTCSFNLAAVIYDTDQTLNNVFTSDPDASGFGACVGVHTGIVKEDLGPDNKPVFSGSQNAIKCFGSEANFQKLFNYSAGVNEVQCYDMPFRHYGTDTRWGYDSDSTHYDAEGNELAKGGFTGGFYPLEKSDDASAIAAGTPATGTCPICRTKRKAEAPVGVVPAFADLDHYCNTPGWDGGFDCGATNMFSNGDTPAAWDWGVREAWTTVTRNQQYCFESHATFTYNEDQEFTFRGDDDIWVFINKKIAVDNGGAHLAAPGHVVLKNLNTTYGAGFLVPGQDYALDIFFCDRRTTMTNVIIKTNMYIKQSTGIELNTEQVAGTEALKLHICVEESGGGDCAAVALGAAEGSKTRKCDGDIDTQVNFSVKTRKGEIPSTCAACAALTPYQVNLGGIDLTNPKVPVVTPGKISGLPPGAYRLYVEVKGKSTYYNFRIKGNLDIVNQDGEFINTDGDKSVYASGTKWKYVDKGMAGTRIPIYITAPDEMGGIDLMSAIGQTYTLTLGAGAQLFKTSDDVNDVTPLATPYAGKIGESGIDTLWVTVPLAGLTSATQSVAASVRNNVANLTFYAPTITFATPATKDETTGEVLTWNKADKDPDFEENGDEYFHWVGADVDFNVIVMNPITGGLCTECNFPIDLISASPRIVGTVSPFTNGVALVRIRSEIEYLDPAEMVVASTQNNSIAATYGNMHFYKPPVPMPTLVDIFDVKGEALGEMNLPGEYHSETAKYLDGRADSIAITYDRAIDKDSLPTFVCVNFDEDNLEEVNPFEKGYSNNSKDTEIHCSTQFGPDEIKKAFDGSPNGGKTLGFSVDVPFTKDVKTLVKPENKIISYAVYKWKGKEAKAGFEKGITDRIAPVILSARASTETDGGVYDQVKIIISEPVVVLDDNYGKQAFSYYLNSAIDVAESARYAHVTSEGRPQNKKDTLTIRYYNADVVNNPTPHVGDYIRFRADKLIWADTSNGFVEGADTLRDASDADKHWNSPTTYNSSDRLPSPWVQVEGDAKIDVTTISFNVADPSLVNDKTPVGKVYPVKTSENLEDVKTAHPHTLGHFVQSDMGSIIGSDEDYVNVDRSEVYFYYEVDYFTNLGNFVGHQSGKIYCTDPFFSATPDDPNAKGDCVKSPRNFFVAWNMVSDKHRLVGTGAYITKFTSYVKLADKGKKAKKEKTEVWGVQRGKAGAKIKK